MADQEGAGQAVIEEILPDQPLDDSLVVAKPDDEDVEVDDDVDETLAERLVGLTEMLPAPVRSLSGALYSGSVYGVKEGYSLLCASTWVFFSSAAILFAPLIFEIERTQMEEMHKQQQRQILLGPNAAVSGSMMPSQPGM